MKSCHHYVRVRLRENQISLEAVDDAGLVVDRHEIELK
jgi:hypothetical protein